MQSEPRCVGNAERYKQGLAHYHEIPLHAKNVEREDDAQPGGSAEIDRPELE